MIKVLINIAKVYGLAIGIYATVIFIKTIYHKIKYHNVLAYDRNKINKLFKDLYDVDVSTCNIVFKKFVKYHFAQGLYDDRIDPNTVFINSDVYDEYGPINNKLEVAIAHELNHYCQFMHLKSILNINIDKAVANRDVKKLEADCKALEKHFMNL